ncbi:MAG: HAD hydrolase-like protein, partial [Sphaerochaetaceae bacterium]|nr:HAD hydrolase-like protein [Sphaerochaetaceae bacterium]
ALDYGGVIADMIEEQGLSTLAAVCQVDLRSFVNPYWTLRPAYDSGERDFTSYMHLVLEACDSPVADTVDYTNLFALDTTSYSHLREPMIRWMTQVKAKGITLIIISNIAVEAAEILIESTPLADLCPYRVYSGRIGINKPHQGIYMHARNLLGTEGSSVLFIDDRLENAVASQAVGFQSAHLVCEGKIHLL